MIVYLFAGAAALGYASAVPVYIAFWLSAREVLRFGVGISAFERQIALRNAREDSVTPKRKTGRRTTRQALRTLRQLRGATFSLRGDICLGDAAATALACGALQALAAAIGARAFRVRLGIAPRFDSDMPGAELRGMIRARVGQIILAAAHSGVTELNGRIAQWKDTPLKA